MASSRLFATVGTRFQSVWSSFTRPIPIFEISSVFSRRSFVNTPYTRLASGLNGWITKDHLNSISFAPSPTLRTENFNSASVTLSRYVSTKPKERLSKQQVSNKQKLSRRNCSSKQKTKPTKTKTETGVVEEPETLSVFQRFKKAYKEHGKVLITVHIATSTVWLTAFYMAAKSGLDVVPLLEKLGASDTIIKPFKSSGLGNIAVAYLLYKLATPARYTVTLGGTNLAIRYLRNKGHMKPIEEGHTLRELYKDSKIELKSRQASLSSQLRHERIEKLKKFRESRRNRSKY